MNLSYIISKGSVKEGNIIDCEQQSIEITVKRKDRDKNTAMFTYNYWSDGGFITVKRSFDKLKITVKENKNTINRQFTVTLFNPCDAEDVLTLEFTQNGVQYIIEDAIHTFVRGFSNEEKKPFIYNGFTSVYTGINEVLDHEETYSVDLSIYGGSKKIYIAGIYKDRISYSLSGETNTLRMAYDGGIRACVENGTVMDDGYRQCKIILRSFGRPFSDNYTYRYTIRVAHYDNPNYYCLLQTEFAYTPDTANPTIVIKDENKIITDNDFGYEGGIKYIDIEFGDAEDCDWSVVKKTCDNFEEDCSDCDWLTVDEFPTSVRVSCEPNNTINEDGSEYMSRECTLLFDINGKTIEQTITQQTFSNFSIINNANNIDLYSAGDTPTRTIVSTGSALMYDGELINEGTLVDNEPIGYGNGKMYMYCTSYFSNGVTHTYMFSFWCDSKLLQSIKMGIAGVVYDPSVNGYHLSAPWIPNLSAKIGEKTTSFIVDAYYGADSGTLDINIENPNGNGSVDGDNDGAVIIQIKITSPAEQDYLDVIIPYCSAGWCQVEIIGYEDDYAMARINVTEENIYGVDRKCKIIFTNGNHIDKTTSCIVTNMSAGTKFVVTKN